MKILTPETVIKELRHIQLLQRQQYYPFKQLFDRGKMDKIKYPLYTVYLFDLGI